LASGCRDRRTDADSVCVQGETDVAQALRFPTAVGHETFPVKVVRWPQVTPDNRSAVFQALGYLYKYDPATGQRSRVTKQSDDYEFAPSLSPDGKSVVYVTWNDTAGGRVKTVNLDGSQPRTVVTRPGHYVTASYSPDGKQIIYQRGNGDGLRGRLWQEDQGIYVVDVLGKEQPRLITREGTSPVSISPARGSIWSAMRVTRPHS